MRLFFLLLVAASALVAGGFPAPPPHAVAPRAGDKAAVGHDDAVRHHDAMRKELVSMNQDVWTFAELGLEEHRSAARLIRPPRAAGFEVKEGVSDMPTAFVASYGSGRPVI